MKTAESRCSESKMRRATVVFPDPVPPAMPIRNGFIPRPSLRCVLRMRRAEAPAAPADLGYKPAGRMARERQCDRGRGGEAELSRNERRAAREGGTSGSTAQRECGSGWRRAEKPAGLLR